jgi:hypothetical protein
MVQYQSLEFACIKGRKKLMNQKTVYEELKEIIYHFPKYHIKILFGDFNEKVRRGNNSKPTIGNASLGSKYEGKERCIHGFGRET